MPASNTIATVQDLNIWQVIPDPEQPRKTFDQDSLLELGASIKEIGLAQPISVIKIVSPHDLQQLEEKFTSHLTTDDPESLLQGTMAGDHTYKTALESIRRAREESKPIYRLIAGERRFRASVLVSLPKIAAIVRRELSEADQDVMAVVENRQRQDVPPYEEALAFRKILATHWQDLSEEERIKKLAKRVGMRVIDLQERLRLLNLIPEALDADRMGILTAWARYELANLTAEQQPKLLRLVMDGKVSSCKQIAAAAEAIRTEEERRVQKQTELNLGVVDNSLAVATMQKVQKVAELLAQLQSEQNYQGFEQMAQGDIAYVRQIFDSAKKSIRTISYKVDQCQQALEVDSLVS